MRHQDWPERLNKIIKESQSKPFVWGQHDCCLFAADVVMELTGIDHAADLRGTYSTMTEAARVIKRNGGIRSIVTNALGAEINPKLAQRGDIVLIDGDYGETLSVCIGAVVVAPGSNALYGRPLSNAITAWRVA